MGQYCTKDVKYICGRMEIDTYGFYMEFQDLVYVSMTLTNAPGIDWMNRRLVQTDNKTEQERMFCLTHRLDWN